MYPARVLYSALFFTLIMGLLIAVRPAAFFTDDGRVRPFGVGGADRARNADPKPTTVPLGTVTVVVAVLAMFLFALIDVVYARPLVMQ